MSRHVTALYDTREEAEAARQRLSSAVSLDSVRIIEKDGGGSSGGNGLGSLYMPDEDRHAYGEGLRRGGFVLCANAATGEDADKIVRLLEESPGVDLEERQNSWRSEGWSPQQAAGTTGTTGTTGTGSGTGMGIGTAATQSSAGGNVVSEEHIPIVEEELRVGKREVERGGARVRSYVREVPVHEQVTLREEHVSVERRPVDQSQGQAAFAGRPEDLLQDREIEMRETAEEAVVQKVAQVREEVVVRKTAEEHVEEINETVRHTEVDVEDGRGGGDRSAFGSFGGNQGGASGTSGAQQGEFDRDKAR